MRLSLKFTLCFLIAMCSILGVFSYLQVQRETAEFDADFMRDHEAMGRDLAAAVARIWVLAGETPALNFVEEANSSKSDINIRWLGRDESVAGDVPTRLSSDQLASFALDDKVNTQRVVIDGKPFSRTYIPVRNSDQWLGSLELSESTELVDQYIRTNIIRRITTTVVIAVITGLIAILLGVWFVGRPVRLLVARTRRIAAGDFTGSLEVQQSDELGTLTNEINAMSDQLREASERVKAESTARIEAIEQLRHADRLRTVGQLTSGIAHELGTPLNVVWERAKMIVREGDGESAAARNAAIIADQAARMTAIIRQLLDFARPRRPKWSRHDLRQIVRQTLGLLKPTLNQRHVNVSLDQSEEGVFAAVDADQVQQVVSNLVLNAAQAMPNGGAVSISFGLNRQRPPSENGAVESNFAFLAVRDEGYGIPPEDVERVFEPFFTTKEIGQGTGLGLSVSLGIVREHGGWIAVDSKPGCGACFTVFLPSEAPR